MRYCRRVRHCGRSSDRLQLHTNATTTPRIRMPIQGSSHSGSVLARHFGVGMETIARWRHHDSVQDRPHTAHRLQTTLSPAQEAMVVYLRRALLLPLEDLLTVTRESCVRRPPGPAWTAVCVATAWGICARCSWRRISPCPKPSRPTSPASCMSM